LKRQGHVVAQSLEALRYKPEGRWLDCQLRQGNISGRSMGSTQLLTEIISRNISWEGGGVKNNGE